MEEEILRKRKTIKQKEMLGIISYCTKIGQKPKQNSKANKKYET